MKALREFQTLDYHTAGEPLRILRSGLAAVPGDSMLAKRRYMQDHHDDVRKLLMLEPRGHADMYGAVITEPVSLDADCGVLFMHNEGYSTMCGHGIIALATAVTEHGLFATREPGRIGIDTPAGRVDAHLNMRNERVDSVSFVNVPAFVLQELPVEFQGRKLNSVIAFGGAFYAYIDAAELGIELIPANVQGLVRAGRGIKAQLAGHHSIRHPQGDEALNFLYGVIFVSQHEEPGRSRNVCVFADGELDRSPTGTGVSGRAAIHFARGEIGLGVPLTIDSICGSQFTVECLSETRVGAVPAVTTRVSGSAYMTGEHRFVLDANDPLPQGLFIR